MVSQVLSALSSLFSLTKGILGVFLEERAPTLQELTEQYIQESKAIFMQQLSDGVGREAIAATTTARDLLAIDYHNALKAGQSDDTLWELLGAEAAVTLRQLQAQEDKMRQWSIDSQKGMAQQNLSLYLLITHLTIAIYQARAKHAPTPAQRQAQRANIIVYAQNTRSVQRPS
ncbi:MAG: hypothetical protein HC927_02280 [Deltaproteobacteria bacterium]|nr:hypothetical protein [Deltaproteobacteria bacterium]